MGLIIKAHNELPDVAALNDNASLPPFLGVFIRLKRLAQFYCSCAECFITLYEDITDGIFQGRVYQRLCVLIVLMLLISTTMPLLC